MKQIDITLEDASPKGHQSKLVPSGYVRFYESSYGGVTVAMYEKGTGRLTSALRISDEDAEKLGSALFDYAHADSVVDL